MWNTGCKFVGNTLAIDINILDGENNHFAITVPARQSVSYNNVIFPWCNSRSEVEGKAFRVSSVDTGEVFMYLFQSYQDNKICWSLPSVADPWTGRHVIRNGSASHDEQVPLPAIDIYLLPGFVFGLAAMPPPAFDDYFGSVVSAVGAAAALVGGVAEAAHKAAGKH
ncbi:MAG TPA: hypothetical protein VHE35_04400 [Kofleriaceae bacterium]|nr:hypothetical protein [Kofleriaceae bacterium]